MEAWVVTAWAVQKMQHVGVLNVAQAQQGLAQSVGLLGLQEDRQEAYHDRRVHHDLSLASLHDHHLGHRAGQSPHDLSLLCPS